ncbi:hypothetical protein [Candidatus Cyanaurora vandensis]|uniref:hypothetical protein n=1 Tax=Candidatus Cyanaurora vandensis TaxID=2714958 RepID=UPI00257CBC5A|nr:hypothetical protein [Candidatus Cyanaurora vandensis]
MNALPPPNSPGQFFLGVILGFGLLLGAGLGLLLALVTLNSLGQAVILGLVVVLGPLMTLSLTFVARKQSFSYWAGALTMLVPGLLLGVLGVLAATLAQLRGGS